jgi:beta-galactosidase
MTPPAAKPGRVIPLDPSNTVTRRDFIKSTALAAGSAFIPGVGANPDPSSTGSFSEKLTAGWEYFQGSLGGVWDVWRQDMAESTVWEKVEVPHCFNAYDAVDPDHPFYEGPGWYRRKLQVKNPYKDGRTLLLFEGAGQKSIIFVSQEQVGETCRRLRRICRRYN